jgi:GNAT superfamily N-acetyltransferase
MPLVLERSWVGRRVTVRRVVDRAADGSLRLADVVGDLVGLDAETAILETRAGPIEVPVAYITAARPALPSTGDELALAAVAARGWRPAEQGAVGGWVLRASGGFTGRGNSVLPLKAAGVPLPDALAQARAWYHERGLPLRFQVPCESRRLLDAELGELGWPPSPDVHVLAARLDVLPRPASAPAVPPTSHRPVELAPAPDDAWLERYRGGAGASAPARALLVNHDHAVFASIRRDGVALAIGRGTIDDGWLGVTAIEVAPEQRRRGLAGAVMAALWKWGRAEGATRSYLEVSADNLPGVALYDKLGYWHHHDYRYRDDPQSR